MSSDSPPSSPSPKENCIIEIDGPPSQEEALPEWIECYVIEDIEPKLCGPLARDLNAVLPLRKPRASSASPRASSAAATGSDATPSFGADGAADPRTDHLKRIRRRRSADERSESETNEKSNPRRSPPWSLDILVGSVAAVDRATAAAAGAEATDRNASPSLLSVLEKYGLSPAAGASPQFVRRALPGRPARTREELDRWNKSTWQTLFFEERTARYKDERKALAPAEVDGMRDGMEEAVKDARRGRSQYARWKRANAEDAGGMCPIAGAVVVDPLRAAVVSTASDERQRQSSGLAEAVPTGAVPSPQSFPDEANPTCTPALLAIQGVSRRERRVALDCGMESNQFQKGQVSCRIVSLKSLGFADIG